MARSVESKASGGELRCCRMPCLDMATLTEPGPIHRQQLLVIGTVRLMAIQTVLSHGRMLPKKRSTLIGMALITILVNRSFRQEFFIRRTVRIVTIAALYFSFPERHVGGTLHLRSSLLVTLEADFKLRSFCKEFLWRRWLHNLVAIHTSKIL